MAGSHARFLASAHSVRAILRAMSEAGGIPGIERIVVNPVSEDISRDADRIHAEFADGELSDTAIEATAGSVTLERRRGTATYATYALDEAASAFLAEVRRELAAPEVAIPVQASRAAVETRQPIELPTARAADKPKARYRTTAEIVGFLREADTDGLERIVVNADPEVMEEGMDCVHVRLDDGSLSRTCLYCAPRSYAVWDGDAYLDELTLSIAAEAFMDNVRNEVYSNSMPARR